MSVQNASGMDKDVILGFCRDTFSWGDYIDAVWDRWMSDGGLQVVRENGLPVAMCHVYNGSNDGRGAWIEGIRVHPENRRCGHARRLINHCEAISQKNGCTISQMLIETSNAASLSLSDSLRYSIMGTWNLYTLDCTAKHHDADFELNVKRKDMLSSGFRYADSWRLYRFTQDSIKRLYREQRLVFSEHNGMINGVAVLARSPDSDKTALVTIPYGDNRGIENVLSAALSVLYNRGYQRVHVLTDLESLPACAGSKRLSLYLVEKSLQHTML